MQNPFRLLDPRIQDGLERLGMHQPTPPQERAIPIIIQGLDVLLIAPTASGKTEAALLPVLNNILHSDQEGIQLIYITPLRALNRDIQRRLVYWADHLGVDIQIRHGDTAQNVRKRQSISPPQILITTPETLQAILPAKSMRANLRYVRHVIVDEVHELAPTKRGCQLAVGLERLDMAAESHVQRIALSATIGNPVEIAGFMGGQGRHVQIVEVPIDRRSEYRVEYPVVSDKDYDLADDLNVSPEAASRLRRIDELIRTHRSTLVFVNGRGEAESLGHRLSSLNNKIAVHHGSLSRGLRHQVEDEFRSGSVNAIVCTSTLQLGIDIGAIDLSLQYHSPRQVSAFVQRAGRSGHRLSASAKAIVMATYSDDFLEAQAAVTRARSLRLEDLRIHENALDVLAHQCLGFALDLNEISRRTLLELVGRSYPYRKIQRVEFEELVDFLSSLGLLRIKGDMLTSTSRGRRNYYENLSMIPDEKRYPFIDVVTDKTIGTVGDEFWSLRARVGLDVILRGQVWRIIQIDEEEGRLYVLPSNDPLGSLPGWDGELIPVPYEVAVDAGALRARLADSLRLASSREEALQQLSEVLGVSLIEVGAAVVEIELALSSGFPIPTDRRVVLEAYDKYLIVHSCFGERVNRTLGCAFDAILSEHDMIHSWWNDAYRILVECPRKLDKFDLESICKWLLPLSDLELDSRINEYMESRFPFAYKMKFVAERFGIIRRGLTLSSERMEDLYRRYKNTPIYAETVREAYLEKLDVSRVRETMESIRTGVIETCTSLSVAPSPFGRHILMQYADIEETMSSNYIGTDQLSHMKRSLESRTVRIACLNCGEWSSIARLRELSEQLGCPRCGRSLIALLERGENPEDLFRICVKWRNHQPLTKDEADRLSRWRKTADLVLSYGRDAILALLVHGVGPQTAYQILSRMHREKSELLSDLLKAKIQYIRNRPFWDAP